MIQQVIYEKVLETLLFLGVHERVPFRIIFLERRRNLKKHKRSGRVFKDEKATEERLSRLTKLK